MSLSQHRRNNTKAKRDKYYIHSKPKQIIITSTNENKRDTDENEMSTIMMTNVQLRMRYLALGGCFLLSVIILALLLCLVFPLPTNDNRNDDANNSVATPTATETDKYLDDFDATTIGKNDDDVTIDMMDSSDETILDSSTFTATSSSTMDSRVTQTDNVDKNVNGVVVISGYFADNGREDTNHL